jgi:hypothetical protein
LSDPENRDWFVELEKKTYRSAARSITGTPDIADLARGADAEVLGGSSEGNRAEEGNGAQEDGGELHFDGFVG